MSTVEATRVNTSAPTDRRETGRSTTARPLSDFASLLASTRESSKALGDMLSERTAESVASRRDQRDARALDRSQKSERADSRRDGTDEVGDQESPAAQSPRAERIEEQTAEQTDESLAFERDSEPSPSQDSAVERVETAPVSSLSAEPRPAPAVGGATAVQEAPAAANESTTVQSSAVGSVGAGSSTVGQSARGEATIVAGAGLPATSGTVPSTGAASNGNANGSGSGGNSLELPATATTRGEGAGRSAGPSTDFQNLLDQLGRQRGSATRAQTLSGTAGGKSDAKGISLTETGSVRELAHVLRSQIGGRHSTMTLQLSPAELGRVRVNMETHDQVVSIRFQAETAAGEQALRGSLNELRGTLEEQGIRLDRVEVETRPPVQPDPAQEGRQDSRHEMPQWDGAADGGQAQQESMPRGSGGSPTATAASGMEDPSGESPRSDAMNVIHPATSGVDLVA